LGWTNTVQSSNGSGTLRNIGVMYENSRSNIQDTPVGKVLPDVNFSVFALYTNAKLDLPTGSQFPQSSLDEFKYGADVTLQTLSWLGFMLRYDRVNMDTQNAGYIFDAVTARAIVSSHFLSSERIYLQYSRYAYGDNMNLAQTWKWGAPVVAGNDVLQGVDANKRPDYNVIKMQAEVAF
jgi:hypothetical protein